MWYWHRVKIHINEKYLRVHNYTITFIVMFFTSLLIVSFGQGFQNNLIREKLDFSIYAVGTTVYQYAKKKMN